MNDWKGKERKGKEGREKPKAHSDASKAAIDTRHMTMQHAEMGLHTLRRIGSGTVTPEIWGT